MDRDVVRNFKLGIRSFSILILTTILSTSALAQDSSVDLLYLKNGSVIRGEIIELVPGEEVRIRTSDGSLFVFSMEEVLRTEQAESSSPEVSDSSVPTHNPFSVHKKVSGISFLSTWAVTLLGASAMNDLYLETTALPVVGPWATILRIENNPFGFYRSGGKPLLITAGILQTGFMTYFIASVIRANNYQSSRPVTISPAGNGIRLTYTF